MKKESWSAFIAVITLLFAAACSQTATYEKIADGMVVHLKNNKHEIKAVKLEVITDEIIHIIASPVDTFSTTKSLMVLQDLQPERDWEITADEREVSLITHTLRASVSLQTGAVTFKDTSGHILLREQAGGGKYFTEITVDGQKSYAVQQVFESPDDEAFYGLGGHQNGQMNYKGEDVDLVQHNIVDVVPFLYSNKNYGILWDNYSDRKSTV